MHYIRYDVLYAYVLSRLQYWSVLAQQDGDKLLKRLLNARDVYKRQGLHPALTATRRPAEWVDKAANPSKCLAALVLILERFFSHNEMGGKPF